MKRLTHAQPKLILVMGVAASGKTTLSKTVLQRFCATYLDNNFIVDAFYPHTRTGYEYLKLRPHFYALLYRIAEENLLLGNSVLLDVPHVKEMQDPVWHALIRKLTKNANATLVVIRCLCSEQVLKERMLSRRKERDAWKLNNWNDFLKEQQIDAHIPFTHLDINTEDDVEINAELVIRYILSEKSEDDSP